MNKNQKKLLIWLAPLLAVAFGTWLLAAKIPDKSKNTVPVYAEGTKITPADSVPPYFPKELIFESSPTLRTSEVIYPDGTKDVNLSYLSKASLDDLLAQYEKFFKSNPWTIQAPYLDDKAGAFFATKNDFQVVLTLVKENNGTKVTIVYKQ